MKIDFVELGIYCQTRYKESHNSQTTKYIKTWFIAINEDNNIFTSTTPHILSNAVKCILIHERSSLAVSNWYEWYEVEFINEYGEVFENRIDDEFELSIYYGKNFADQVMKLCDNHRQYYACRAPWGENIKKVWQLYCRLKETKSESERYLISSMFKKDEKILELEKKIENFNFTTHFLEEERNTYKNLLDELKHIIKEK